MNSMVVGGANVCTSHTGHLVLVPDLPQADVRDISSAPSAVRRRHAMRLESPSMRRRPVKPRTSQVKVSSSFSVRALVSWTLMTSVLGLAGIGLGLLAQPDSYSGPTRVHSVTAGESVWSLAQTISTDRSLEEVVVDIESLNNIDGGLAVGQQIRLPVH